jgi:tetratricopeptide (TPR) repeat protein
MKNLLLILTLFATLSSQACLNYYYDVDKHGHTHVFGEIKTPAPAFNMNFNAKKAETKLTKLIPQIEETGDYKLLSDYAVLLLKSGKHKLALDLMQVLYHNHSDQYQLAANLGTAFEINGNLDSALFYIKRGMELNPDAHEGSEWVHIKVLETKSHLIDNPSYLSSNSVLGISEEAKANVEIRNQILIQVQERFPFTPGPDPIMASILLDLGDCYKNTESIEFAAGIYNLAGDYYGASPNVTFKKTHEIDSLRKVYSSVKLKKGEIEELDLHGDLIKTSKIKEYKILDDNNEENYQIDFSMLNLDLVSLLSLVNLTQLPQPIKIEIIEHEEIEEVVSEIDDKAEEKDKKGSNFIFYLLGAVTLILIVVIVKKNRS